MSYLIQSNRLLNYVCNQQIIKTFEQKIRTALNCQPYVYISALIRNV